MVQKVEQTHSEKMEMYMKLPKEQLAEMLIECNRNLEMLEPEVYFGKSVKTRVLEEIWPAVTALTLLVIAFFAAGFVVWLLLHFSPK